jgi:hypothetical protein
MAPGAELDMTDNRVKKIRIAVGTANQLFSPRNRGSARRINSFSNRLSSWASGDRKGNP